MDTLSSFSLAKRRWHSVAYARVLAAHSCLGISREATGFYIPYSISGDDNDGIIRGRTMKVSLPFSMVGTT